MKTLIEHLDELETLARAVGLGRIQPQNFVHEFYAGMRMVYPMVSPAKWFVDADQKLTSLVYGYEQNPDLASVRGIKDALDTYKTEALDNQKV